ncbi:MAG: TonB-dependent receptor domain-containing protein, partial [Bryobacteraceae bacterium]
FFFGTFERTQQQSATTGLITVPTLQQRTGDFSDYRTASGQPITIFNPFDTYTNAEGEIKRRPFPGNRIPASMIDPVAAKAASYYPEPNQPGNEFTQQNNWFGQGVNQNTSNQGDIKLDWAATDNNRFTTRYSHARSNNNPANLFGNVANQFNTGPGVGRTHNVVGDFTRMHTPTTVLTFRYGYLHQYGDRLPFEEFDPTTLGLPAEIRDNADFLVFPNFAPDGYDSLGSRGWLVVGREESVHQFSGSMTKIVGGHNLKLGGEFRHFRLDYLQPGHPSGEFVFNRQITREDRFAGSAVQGNGFASMLLGWGSGSSFHHDPWSYSRSRYWGFYAQDDWKVTRKLTLNLGLRYDFDIPRWERDNRYSYWNLDDPSPLDGQVPGMDLRGFFEFADDETRSPFDGDYNNWQPRIGFAYALTPKTAIRGGYGLFYQLSRATVKGHLGAGFSSSSTVDWSRDANITRYATLSNPYPNGLNLPPGRSLGPMTFIGLGAGTIVRENRNPSYQSWNLSVQRELPLQSVIEVNYTGSKGTHLTIPDTSLNRLDPMYWSMGRTALNRKVDNPFYGIITNPVSLLSQPTIEQHRLLRPFPQYTSVGRGGSEPTRGNSSYH